MEGMIVVTLTPEQIKERDQMRDAIHAQHGLTFVELSKYLSRDDHMYNHDLEAMAAYKKCLDKAAAALEYFNELLPSKGFWGRMCARLTAENRKLKAELEQQRFNNAHNLSIDQKVADKISSLEAQVKELEEYKWKYEDLCK